MTTEVMRVTKEIALRATVPKDEPIVRRAHVAHRQAVFVQSGLEEEAARSLSEQHHRLLELHIAVQHASAEHWTILHDGIAVGRLCVDKSLVPWRLVDLALIPEARGLGIGGGAVRQLLRKAEEANSGIDLHVADDNPSAERLYGRLGFLTTTGPNEIQRRMEWKPPNDIDRVHADRVALSRISSVPFRDELSR